MNPREMAQGQPADIINGIRIVSSPYAVSITQVRNHKRRRSQSKKYHLRIQKKWRKRWGTKEEPAAYFLSGDILGHINVAGRSTGRLSGSRTVVAHPSLVESLKQVAAGKV